jgi:hypothetical protein
MVASTTAMAIAYFLFKGSRLGINDMSLPKGGLFDICSTWLPPHKMHRRGTSVDLDHNSYYASGATGPSIVQDLPRFLDNVAALLGLSRIKEDKPIAQGGSIHYECPFVCSILP